MLGTWVGCRMISRRRACSQLGLTLGCSLGLQAYRSKIMTAGVIRVAEPAATTTSAARSSAMRLLVWWMPNGSALSSSFCDMFVELGVISSSEGSHSTCNLIVRVLRGVREFRVETSRGYMCIYQYINQTNDCEC